MSKSGEIFFELTSGRGWQGTKKSLEKIKADAEQLTLKDQARLTKRAILEAS